MVQKVEGSKPIRQRTLTKGGNITVRLTSCLFCLDSAALVMLNEQHFYLFGQIQICQKGGQPFSDTSPKVSVFCIRLLSLPRAAPKDT